MWLPLPNLPLISIKELSDRAWEIRKKVNDALFRMSDVAHRNKLWKSALADISSGASAGPFFDEGKVSEVVGSDARVPTARFPVVQREKVRGVDAARMSKVNAATAVSEKLALASVD